MRKLCIDLVQSTWYVRSNLLYLMTVLGHRLEPRSAQPSMTICVSPSILSRKQCLALEQ